MKNLAFTIVVSGVAAAVLGMAAPAQADYGHHQWIGDMGSSSSAPQVSTNGHR